MPDNHKKTIEDRLTPTTKNYPDLDLSKAPQKRSFWRWLYFCLKPRGLSLSLLAIHALARRIFWFLPPFIIAAIIQSFETGIAYEDPWQAWKWLVYFAIGMVFVTFLLWVNIWVERLAGQVISMISTKAFQHLMSLSVDWHELTGSGNKMQRLLMARTALKNLKNLFFWEFLPFLAALTATVFSIIALDIDYKYIAYFIAFLTSFVGFVFCFRRFLQARLDHFQAVTEDLVGSVYEFLRSVPTVVSYGLQKYVLGKAKEHELTNIKSVVKVGSGSYIMWISINLLGIVWVVFICSQAVMDTLRGEMTIAALSLVAYMSFQLWNEAERFPRLFREFVEAKNAFMRLIDYFLQENEVYEPETPQPLSLAGRAPSIHFQQIDFNYNERVPVFKNLDLKVSAGEKVGIVGSSGAGKTTLVKLLCRFYDPQAGHIMINERPILETTLHDLREQIAIIPQDIELFNHPLIENIRYGRLDASDEEVWAAVEKAYATDFIQALPDGIHTHVGERGVKLSGGQRQRIAVARAILKNAPILILDEATSALDSESEAFIKESLRHLMADKTVLAIAHRLSTLQNMDRILVMEQGRIVEEGAHEELSARKNGIYARLWAMQSGDILKVA